MRCHSQALTIKLKKNVPLAEIEGLLGSRQRMGEGGAQSTRGLDPGVDAGSGHRHAQRCRIGRLRKLPMGGEYLAAFTVGDQLLWGAAEPLRRMLRILLEQ